MSNLIRRGELIYGLVFSLPFFNNPVEIINITIGKKYISCLRLYGNHMINPVLFFFGTREFMFLNNIIGIIFNRRKANKACLAFAGHRELIDIIAGFVFAE